MCRLTYPRGWLTGKALLFAMKLPAVINRLTIADATDEY